MKLKVPELYEDTSFKCDIRGMDLRVGDVLKSGDYIAELRYERIDDSYSDCPVVYYGELIAESGGIVKSLSENLSGPAGMVFGDIGEGESDFPVRFETF